MRKKFLVLMLILSIILTSGLSASSFAYENLNTAEEVYNKSVQLSLIELKKDGTVEYLGKQEDLNISNDLYNDFLERIYDINFLISRKLAFVSGSNLQIKALSPEETENVSSNANSSLENYITSSSISPRALPDEYPSLDLRGLVRDNRREFKSIRRSYMNLFPRTAEVHIGYWWVGKVKTGGDWDYKVKAGFRPYNRKFNATTFTGTKVITSEYIGNYNYGFTGEMILSLSTLYRGGEFAAGHLFTPEGMDDRTVIREGYYDAVDYW